jgi:hypothetical protein
LLLLSWLIGLALIGVAAKGQSTSQMSLGRGTADEPSPEQARLGWIAFAYVATACIWDRCRSTHRPLISLGFSGSSSSSSSWLDTGTPGHRGAAGHRFR